METVYSQIPGIGNLIVNNGYKIEGDSSQYYKNSCSFWDCVGRAIENGSQYGTHDSTNNTCNLYFVNNQNQYKKYNYTGNNNQRSFNFYGYNPLQQ